MPYPEVFVFHNVGCIAPADSDFQDIPVKTSDSRDYKTEEYVVRPCFWKCRTPNNFNIYNELEK